MGQLTLCASKGSLQSTDAEVGRAQLFLGVKAQLAGLSLNLRQLAMRVHQLGLQ